MTAAERSHIAVVGAGLMGHGLAQVLACAGHPVAVYDPLPETLATAHERLAEAPEGAEFVFEAAPETADLGGLDLALSIHEQILPSIDGTPGPLQILRDKVAAGELGMKTGQGFLPLTEETAAASHTRLADHLIAALTDERAPPDTAAMT